MPHVNNVHFSESKFFVSAHHRKQFLEAKTAFYERMEHSQRIH